MTENQPKGLRIESWMSINGRTYAVADGHCVLSLHKSEEEAKAALEAYRKAREEREKEWADPNEGTGPPA